MTAEERVQELAEGFDTTFEEDARHKGTMRREMLRHLREAVAEERERCMKLALTCCSCKKVLNTLSELKAHIVVCPEHPIAQYVAAERAACAQVAEAWQRSYQAIHGTEGNEVQNGIAAAIRARGKS